MAGELRATIFAATKGFENVKKAATQLGGLQKQFGELTYGGKLLVGSLKGIGAAAAAIGATGFVFGKQAVGESKQLEQNMLGLKTVFGELTPQMEKFSQNAYNIGLSQAEAGKASTFLGSVLKQSGFEMGKTADTTEELVTLATDLAATYGYDVQDALLGMTALFRGEYDPIEKFGVAMKQNEINAELAARGQDNLSGAARRNAEQQIRLELLLQRSTDAQGAMARGAGNLFVEQAKLEAQFKNMQAAVGQALTPALADLAEQLGPVIQDILPDLVKAFEIVGEIIVFIGKTIKDLFDPTTELGDKFLNLKESFNLLWNAVFGRDFDLQALFDAATWAANLFLDVLNGIVRLVFSLALDFQALGIMIKAVFTGDWDTVKKGLSGIKNELYDAADAALATAKANAILKDSYSSFGAEDNRFGNLFDTQPSVIAERLKKAEEEGNDLGEAIGSGAKDALKDFWAGLYDDIEKQNAKNKLGMLGASEGLIDAVLGSGAEWEKVFSDIVKNGIASVTSAQAIFNKTAAGIKEIEEAAKAANEQLQKLQDMEIQRTKAAFKSAEAADAFSSAYDRMMGAGYSYQDSLTVAFEDAADAIVTQQNAIAQSYAALSQSVAESSAAIFGAFATSEATESVGEFTQSVRDLKEGLSDLVTSDSSNDQASLFNDLVQGELLDSINRGTDIMEVLASARDRMVLDLEDTRNSLQEQIGNRQSLLESVYESVIGTVNITAMGSKATTIIKSLKETLSQTKAFAGQITQLREQGVNGSFIDQIIGAGALTGGATAKALIEGGPKAISEINSLYSQIDDVANEIGTQAADSMYGAGISATTGLLDGLLSQESELAKVAEQLADSFQNAFDLAVEKGQTRFVEAGYLEILEALKAGQPAPSGTYYGGRQGSGTFNITVNAGVGTDGKSVGQQIVDEILRFERQSGKVFVSA